MLGLTSGDSCSLNTIIAERVDEEHVGRPVEI